MWIPGFREFNWMQDMWLELDRMQREVGRLFSGTSIPYSQSFPSINLWSGENIVLATAEIPGISPESVNISVEGDLLTISGSRAVEELQEGEAYHRQERPHGTFSRKVRLPFRVDGNKVDASYARGILNVKLPRVENDKPRKITIKSD
ncbi:MAG: Hsp20/alpha crystallin family protein [Deltaproteobacteria bacterium]|nr:Hsp20/alpha crystallin family protein [Deltaproteobacteria bacterium]MBN2686695.1 Hsp20/alpha crystallin family protein [Deltaproteobacteria bacterium]